MRPQPVNLFGEKEPEPKTPQLADPLASLAHRYGRARGWTLDGIVDKPDLLGEPRRIAVFADRRGLAHERSEEDMRRLSPEEIRTYQNDLNGGAP